MSRSPDQPVDAIQQAVPRSAPSPNAPEAPPAQRIPFKWRLVLGFWVVCGAILVLYEVMAIFARVFSPASN